MIEILRIVGAFGIRGAVRVESYSDDLKRYKKLYTSDGKEFGFRVVRPGVIHLDSVVSRNDAEDLKWVSLYVREEDLAPLREDEFYLHQLIGKTVQVENSDLSCTITDVCNYGAGDIIELTFDGCKFMVPFTASNFPDNGGQLCISEHAFKCFRE